MSDSSSDLIVLDNIEFASSPMKIITAKREFVDDENLNVDEMKRTGDEEDRGRFSVLTNIYEYDGLL